MENTFEYDEKSILEIYEKRDEHERYSIVYESFLSDLKKRIAELQENCTSIFEKLVFTDTHTELPLFDDQFNLINMPGKITAAKKKESYHYELGKLSTKRQPKEFDFFSRFIRSKCSDRTVLYELDRMKGYLDNDVEYFSSYKLISRILNEDD